jgi:hypothetical protein
MNLRYAIDRCMYMSVCLSGCNEMYCDETTNAANIPFGTDTSWQLKSSCQATWRNSVILAVGRHLEFPKANIWKCYNFWTVWNIDPRPASFCSGLRYLELWLHWILATTSFSIHKMVLCKNPINAITSEPFDRFTSIWRRFVQGRIANNSRCIMIVIKVKMAASRQLDFARI